MTSAIGRLRPAHQAFPLSTKGLQRSEQCHREPWAACQAFDGRNSSCSGHLGRGAMP
jgi:hypothetical protein